MCSSRIERIQAAATCVGPRAAPRGLPLPPGRRGAGSNAAALLEPGPWEQPFDPHPIPPPARGREQDAVGRRARRSIPFLDGVIQVASGPTRVAASARRGPAPPQPHRHRSQPRQSETRTRPDSRSQWVPTRACSRFPARPNLAQGDGAAMNLAPADGPGAASFRGARVSPCHLGYRRPQAAPS